MTLSCRVRAKRGAFDLDVTFDGEAPVIGIVGASGAGKTTLLQAIAGLIPNAEVALSIDESDVVNTSAGLNPAIHERRFGLVFQDLRLFPHLSVGQNIDFGRRYTEAPPSIGEVLRLVDLEGFGARRVAGLSGGEARRVVLARALASRPRLLLLDEPFSGVDDARRDAIAPYLVRLRDELKMPMLLVSHDPRDVAAICEDVIEFAQGKVIGRRRSPNTAR